VREAGVEMFMKDRGKGKQGSEEGVRSNRQQAWDVEISNGGRNDSDWGVYKQWPGSDVCVKRNLKVSNHTGGATRTRKSKRSCK